MAIYNRQAGSYDITIEQGATLRIPLSYKTRATLTSTPVPVNLTGFTAKMVLRRKIGSPIVLELTNTNGGLTIDATEGRITILINASQTEALQITQGVYALEVSTTPAGASEPDVRKLLKGIFIVKREII